MEGQPKLIREVERASEGGPKVLRSVEFREIRSKGGRIQSYQSGAFGRKSVELSNYSRLPELGKSYTVRIIEDTKPDDPLSGKYIVEIVREDGDIEHRGALVAKTNKLRKSPSFQTLAQIVNTDVDLSAEYRMVTGRAAQFKGLQVTEGEHHRAHTAMFAGMMMAPRARDLLELTIDRTTKKDSDFLKGEIQGGNNYVDELVVGSGVHGSIWALTRQMYLPYNPSLTVERSQIPGGQFAEYGRAIFRKNDRQRPEKRDMPHLPGTKQSLTTFTDYATMQPSDMGGEAYPYQNTTADTGRVNFFLSGRAILDSDIQRVSNNPNKGVAQGKYIVDVLDRETGRMIEVSTDRVVFTTGVGEEVDRLDKDEQTQKILAEEKEKHEKGEDAQVNSFTEFCKRAGDRSNPFPMEGIKRLVLSGDGDSAVVVAGIALGYESQLGKTTTQLDNVEEIIWIGPKWLTKEDFCEKARARYHWVGLDFPRKAFEDYYHRITPVANRRSYRLRRKDGQIGVECTPEAEDRKSQKGAGSNEVYYGDHYVYCHGFSDRTDEIVGPLINDIYEDNRIDTGLNNIFKYENGQVYYSSGPIRKLQVTAVKGETVKCRTISKKGEIVEYEFSQGEREKILPKKLLDKDNILRVEVGYNDPVIGTSDVYSDEEPDIPIGKRLYNVRIDDSEVYKAGPASKLPLTETEKAQSKPLAAIPENTAAIFRYANYTADLCRQCAKEDVRQAKKAPMGLMAAEPKVNKPKRKKASKQETVVASFNVSIDKPGHKNRVPYSLNTLDGLKLVIGDMLGGLTFPENLDSLELKIRRTGESGEDAYTYTVESKPELPLDVVESLNGLFADSLYGQFINKVTTLRGKASPNTVIMNIPFGKGKVSPAGITYIIPKK